MGESNDNAGKTKARYPELERRKSRGLSYGEASERAKHEQARSLDDDAAFYLDNAAFYLIEREAIELRRLRWQSSEEHKRVSKRVDEIASERKGKWGPRIASGAALSPEQRLAQYARPLERAEASRPGLFATTKNAVSRGVGSVGHMIKGVVRRKRKTRPNGRRPNQGNWRLKAEPNPPRCPVPPTHPPEVHNLVGLAFSGGGIRSASFNLGVLQGLESRGVLWIFDYLSTVSGGGFIGSWWSAWLSREKREVPAIFPDNEELEPGRRADTAVLLSGKDAAPLAPGSPDGSRIARRDDPIHFLRLFSNYLTPKTGVLSPDTWRMLAFYIRGLLFTWVVLLPLLLAAVMFGQTFFMTKSAADAFVCAPAPPPSPPAATAPYRDAAAEQRRAHPEGYCAGPNVPRLTARQARWIRVTHAAKPMAFLVTMYATLAILWLVYASSPWWLALVSFIAVGALTMTKIVPYFSSSQADRAYEELLPLAVGAGLAAHGAQVLLKVLVKDKRNRDPIAAGAQAASNQPVTLGADDYRGMLGKQQATLLELIFFAGVLLLLAGFGHDVVNWMVTRASSTIGAVGWSGVAMALISGTYTVYKALPSTHGGADAAPGKLGKILMAIAPPLVLVVLGLALAWLSQALLMSSANQPEDDRLTTLVSVATFLGLLQAVFAIIESHRDPALPATVSTFWHRLVPESLLPASAQSSGRTGGGRWLYLFSPRGWVRVFVAASLIVLFLAKGYELAAFVTLLTLATASLTSSVALGTLATAGLVTFVPRTWPVAIGSARPATLLSITSGTATLSLLGSSAAGPTDGVFLIAPLWIAILIGFVVCMGWLADPNLLSIHGFFKGRLARAYLGASNTARYNEEITDSAPCDDIELTGLTNHDVGAPYQIINTTLSLVGGSDLAMSQRSAENFIMSRYHCGSARAGYRCTAEYMDGQLSLATATAVSGAAVSPNMGSKTPSAALALFLSLFNVRLGFWAPTPSGRRWREPHARLWPFYILRETLSNTGQIGSYCYLTDGGHFDNTGLYALVERGCRYIVVSDCGADPDLGFEDIGVAIRRCRIDFGAEIDLRIDDFAKRTRRDRITTTHFVWGNITYQPEHLTRLGLSAKSAQGVIVWIKPAVTPKDAVDVQQYHRANTDFPQQSTAEQWYDESQFESYRRLGYSSARDAFEDLPADRAAPMVQGNFDSIRGWFDAQR